MKMFWGLILEPGKKYEQKTEASFHLTMAALEPSSKTPTPNKPSFTSVIAESNKTPFILCNLDQDKVAQQPLDLVFTEGEPISFSVNGQNKVHLTGYIMPDSDMEDSEDMYDLDGSEDDSEAEEMLAALANDKKRKQAPDAKDANKKVKFGGDEVQAAPGKAEKKQEKAKQQPAKAGKNDVAAKPNQKPKLPVGIGEDEDDEDDEEDDDMDSEDMNDLLDQFDDDDDDDDEEDDEDEDESSPEAKKPAKPQGKPQIQKGTPAKGGQQPKQEKNQNQNNQQGTPQQKKPFQGGNKNQPWSGNKNKGQNNFSKNQNSGKKGTPQNSQKFGGSPGNKNKKPWQNKK